jgi:hypothetical protein
VSERHRALRIASAARFALVAAVFLLAATWCVSLLAKPGSAPLDVPAATAAVHSDVATFEEPSAAHQCCDSIANPDASTVSPLMTSLRSAIRWSVAPAIEVGVVGLVLAVSDPRRTRGHLQVWRH